MVVITDGVVLMRREGVVWHILLPSWSHISMLHVLLLMLLLFYSSVNKKYRLSSLFQ